ncbi:G-patch domain-containing protein [Hirschfeldia incana]|nr:G-patch domain-containing protein [Hirschfeldia incana]
MADDDENKGNKGKWTGSSGIGFDLMIKMGYDVNSGLGKNDQGMKDPIQVSKRQPKVGLGFSRERVNNDPVAEVEEEVEIEDEEDGLKKFKAQAAAVDKSYFESLKKKNSQRTPEKKKPTPKKSALSPYYSIKPQKKAECVKSCMNEQVPKALVPYENDSEEDVHVGGVKQVQVPKALVPYESDSEEDVHVGGVKEVVPKALVPYESDSEEDVHAGGVKQVEVRKLERL